MKKMSFITLSHDVLQWLQTKLADKQGQLLSSRDLCEGIDKLTAGEIDALAIEVKGGTSAISEDSLICDDLIIYPRGRLVTRNGERIQLTPKEFDILYFLADNRGEVFTKEQIYQAVWAEEFYLADSNIMAFIRKLRKKIEPNPDDPKYILTVWGIGYKFNDKL